MANPTVGFGLRFARRLDESAPSMQLITRRIAYNEGSSIFTGDLVEALVDGYVEAWTAGDSAAVLGGVFMGCKYLNPSTGVMGWFPAWTAPSLPSTTVVEARILVDTNVLFAIRTSDASAAVGIADIGANFDVTVGAGNALTGQSTTTMLSTTPATTATLPLKMIDVYPGVTSGYNDNTLVNNIVLVKLNSAQWFQTAGITT